MTDVTHLLWLDYETNGTDEINGHLLEVGAILTERAAPYMEVARPEFSATIIPADPKWAEGMPQVVLEMHTRNGLLAELVDPTPSRRESMLGIQIHCGQLADVDSEMVGWLASHKLRPFQVALAGSGVGHFDGRWVRRHQPKLAKWLPYAPGLDVGQVRRFWATLDLEPAPRPEAKEHRGIADIRDHLDEARFYAAKLAVGT